MDSKVLSSSWGRSGNYGGGVGGSTSGMNEMYEANIILSIDNKNRINIIKSRFQKIKKDLNKNEVIEVLLDMLCRYLYDGCMDVFQEGMKSQLKEVINQTLEGGELNDNSVRRESISDGVNPART